MKISTITQSHPQRKSQPVLGQIQQCPHSSVTLSNSKNFSPFCCPWMGEPLSVKYPYRTREYSRCTLFIFGWKENHHVLDMCGHVEELFVSRSISVNSSGLQLHQNWITFYWEMWGSQGGWQELEQHGVRWAFLTSRSVRGLFFWVILKRIP